MLLFVKERCVEIDIVVCIENVVKNRKIIVFIETPLCSLMCLMCVIMVIMPTLWGFSIGVNLDKVQDGDVLVFNRHIMLYASCDIRRINLKHLYMLDFT